MNLIIRKVILTSILVGACFVLGIKLKAQTDSILVKDSVTAVIVSENPDTLVSDSAYHLFSSKKRSPKIAVISSAIIPGLGQIYNGKIYKVPLIYGSAAIFYYYYNYYNYHYKRFITASYELRDNGFISDPDLQGADKGFLELQSNHLYNLRTYQLLFLGLVYVANVVDAMVDAYMYEFDVSDDLSFKIAPSLLPLPTDTFTASAGLRINFRF